MQMIKMIKKICGKFFPITYSRVLFYQEQKYNVNLKNPKNFNEKLMWLKIYFYNNDEDVWNCSDKLKVRNYALSKGVKESNLPKLLGIFNDANDINYDLLPNKFALKCSHGCGFNIIVTNKQNINFKETNNQLNQWLKTKFGYESAENHYTHIKPCIMIEEYIDSSKGLPFDYKVYCFNGIPRLVLVCSEREKNLRLNYFDLNWKELPYGKKSLRNQNIIKKPTELNKMIEISKLISKKFPFVRVDFYQYKNKAILGEMTFTPAQCRATYYSEEGNKELSKLLDISNLINKK